MNTFTQRIRALGIEETARRYFPAMRAPGDEEDRWIVEALRRGEDRDNETYLLLVVAAAADEDDLWLVGDGPIEEERLPRAGMGRRLKDLRETHRRSRDLWRVMDRHYREDLHHDPNYWGDRDDVELSDIGPSRARGNTGRQRRVRPMAVGPLPADAFGLRLKVTALGGSVRHGGRAPWRDGASCVRAFGAML